MNSNAKLVVGLFIAVIVLFLFVIINPMVIVRAGERGVLLKWGAVQGRVLSEGIHWVMPIRDDVEKVNVQTQKIEASTASYSKDIQTVTVALALNYHIKPELAGKIWQEVGKDFQARLIDPAIQEAVKSATAKFTAQELVEQRPKVKDEIKVELLNRLNSYFVVDEFSITNFDFSDAYEGAVEAKQVAQQKAFEQENISKQIDEQAKQRVTTARAEAEAIKIQAEAITQQGGRDYVQLKAIEKWSGELPQSMIPGGTVPFLDLSKIN